MPRNTQIQLRRGSTSDWSASTQALAVGEPGFNTTTKELRIGDGSLFGSTSNVVATPSSHASTHGSAGSDPVSLNASQITAGQLLVANGGTGTSTSTGTGSVVLSASPTFSGTVNLPTGSTSAAPVVFPSGTLKTAVAAGALEYDGKVIYSSTATTNTARGVVPSEQFVISSSDWITGNTTAGQATAIFANSTSTGLTNGAVTVSPNTTYFFEAQLYLAQMSATSGNGAFSILGAGTATISSNTFHVVGVDATSGNAATQTGSYALTPASPASLLTNGTGTIVFATITGVIRVGSGTNPTIIPTFTPTDAPTSTGLIVRKNTWFRMRPVGTDTVQSVGNWS
jgi:hypothetical protein